MKINIRKKSSPVDSSDVEKRESTHLGEESRLKINIGKKASSFDVSKGEKRETAPSGEESRLKINIGKKLTLDETPTEKNSSLISDFSKKKDEGEERTSSFFKTPGSL